MGATWEAVLVQAAQKDILSLPINLLPVADKVIPRIQFTLVATRHSSVGDVWCLQCFGVNKNPLHVGGRLPDMLAGHAELAAPLPLAKHAAFSATVALAISAAAALSRATYVFYSDGLCRSGGIRFRPEPVESVWSEPGSPGGYASAVVSAAQPYVPQAAFVEDVWEAFDGASAVRLAWRLLDRHELQSPPRRLVNEHP